MPYCHSCGKEIPSDARFCPFCGASQLIQPQPPISPSMEEWMKMKDPGAVTDSIKKKMRGGQLTREDVPAVMEMLFRVYKVQRTRRFGMTDMYGFEDPDLVEAVWSVADKYPDEFRPGIHRLVQLVPWDTAGEGLQNYLYALPEAAERFPDEIRVGAPKLIEIFGKADYYARENLTDALWAIGKKYPGDLKVWASKLVELLADKKKLMDLDASFLLITMAERHPDNVVTEIRKLIELLGRKEDDLIRNVADALGKVAERYPDYVKPAVPKLMELLGHKNSSVREKAVYALGNIGDRKALDLVKGLANDKKVSKVAREAVAKLERAG